MEDQTKTVQALQKAMKMEIDGKQFYLKAARNSQNELGKALFLALAGEEDLHLLKFKKIFETIKAQKKWPRIRITPHAARDLKTLFAAASADVHSASSEIEAIQTAMTMENQTRDFYQEQAETAGFAVEKHYYTLLAGEESAHHAALLDYYEYLSNPGQYFTLKERHSLDGG